MFCQTNRQSDTDIMLANCNARNGCPWRRQIAFNNVGDARIQKVVFTPPVAERQIDVLITMKLPCECVMKLSK